MSDVLTKVAENASGRNGIVETKTKNSRNFVFAALSPPKSEDNIVDIENDPRPVSFLLPFYFFENILFL